MFAPYATLAREGLMMMIMISVALRDKREGIDDDAIYVAGFMSTFNVIFITFFVLQEIPLLMRMMQLF